MSIEYTDVAISDLIRLRGFIAVHNSPTVKQAVSKLIAGINSLMQQPRLGHPEIRAPDPEKIRDLILPPYIVRYTLLLQSILIPRIWHHKEEQENESTT